MVDNVETIITMVSLVSRELPYKAHGENKFTAPDQKIWWVKVLAVDALSGQKNDDVYATDICAYDIIKYRPLQDRDVPLTINWRFVSQEYKKIAFNL
jgi:hypothetical protein